VYKNENLAGGKGGPTICFHEVYLLSYLARSEGTIEKKPKAVRRNE
jgi:hypothetical protein